MSAKGKKGEDRNNWIKPLRILEGSFEEWMGLSNCSSPEEFLLEAPLSVIWD